MASPVPLMCVVAIVTCLLTSSIHGASREDAHNLYHFLHANHGFRRDIRPMENDTGMVHIFLGFALLSVVDVEEKEQKLVTTARLEFQWNDEWLSWDPEKFGGLDSILVKQKDMWVPDVVVGNSMTSQDQLGFDNLLLRVSSAGLVHWDPTCIIITSCAIDITFYPFDTQVCNIIFETAMSSHEEVEINVDETKGLILRSYNEDGQWDLLDTREQNLETDEGTTKIRFSLLLRRRTTFYIVNMITPVMFLSLMATLVFALPPSTGEKTGMAITVLLAYAVYLTIVSDHLPSTSAQISLLALYLTILLGISAFSVVISVFIIRLHHRPDSKRVGRKMARLTLLLRRITHKAVEREVRPPEQTSWSSKSYNNVKGIDEPATSKSTSHSDPPVNNLQPMTWSVVAETLDWFFFLTFTSLNTLVTVGGLIALTAGAVLYSPSLPHTFPARSGNPRHYP